MSPWSNCTGRCGSAKRHRRIWCSHNERSLDDNYCLQIDGKKPSNTETCNKSTYCPDWAIGMWSAVSGIFLFKCFILSLQLVLGSNVFIRYAI